MEAEIIPRTDNRTVSNLNVNQLRVIYTNADQFINKRDDLLLFIAGNEPDIILISEILPKAPNVIVSKPQLALPGFSMFLNFDPDDQSSYTSGLRGVAIYVADELVASEVRFSDCDLSDCISVSLRLRGYDSLFIGCIYRSPSSPLSLSTEQVCVLLQKATTFSRVLVCGGFIYPSIDWSSDSKVTSGSQSIQLFLDTLSDLFLHQHVTEPTRYRAGSSPHILDLILTNEEDMVQDIAYHPGLGLSDHVCICFTVLCNGNRAPSQIPRLNLYRANYDGMRESLSAIDWYGELSLLNTDDAWNYFYNVFDNAIKENIPVNHATSKKNIYMTREAMRLKNTKYRLWRKYCMTRTQSDHDAFACVRNDLRLLTRSLRHNFKQSITANIHHNPKAFWRYAKSRLKTRATYCDIHDSDGNLLHADSAKASAFNQYFSNVFINEDCTDLPSFSIGHTVPSLNDVDTSPSVVFHKLIALQCCKSPGPDGLPPVALKETAAEISVPLSIIFSKSLQSGQLPDCWKIANVVPIYKSGSRHVTNNYRPISLTCVIGKVLESLSIPRILNFPSLSYRRKRGDMIALYQILRGHIDLNISDHFNFPTYTSTRGHMMKLFKSRSSSRVRSNFFSYRVINDWNSLPDYIINSPSVSIFKHHLDCHWSALLYDNDFN